MPTTVVEAFADPEPFAEQCDWPRAAVGCTTDLGAVPGCDAGETCMPVFAAPFEDGTCVRRDGDVACPNVAYTHRRLFDLSLAEFRNALVPVLLLVAVGLFGYPLFSPASATILALAFALALAPTTIPRLTAPRLSPTILWSVAGLALSVLAIHQVESELAITAALDAHARGDDARGLAAARRAVREFPSADACFYHGNFELALGTPRDAVVAYRRSHALRPRPQTLANLQVARRAATE